jgi:hypothetical protein
MSADLGVVFVSGHRFSNATSRNRKFRAGTAHRRRLRRVIFCSNGCDMAEAIS